MENPWHRSYIKMTTIFVYTVRDEIARLIGWPCVGVIYAGVN